MGNRVLISQARGGLHKVCVKDVQRLLICLPLSVTKRRIGLDLAWPEQKPTHAHGIRIEPQAKKRKHQHLTCI